MIGVIFSIVISVFFLVAIFYSFKKILKIFTSKVEKKNEDKRRVLEIAANEFGLNYDVRVIGDSVALDSIKKVGVVPVAMPGSTKPYFLLSADNVRGVSRYQESGANNRIWYKVKITLDDIKTPIIIISFYKNGRSESDLFYERMCVVFNLTK